MSDYVGLDVSIPFAIGWAVCTGINAASYLFIRSNYDTSKSVYFAHMLKASIMTIGCLVLALFYMYLAFATDCTGAFCCTCVITLLEIIPEVQAWIAFGISLIRLNRLLNADLNNAESLWFDDFTLIEKFKWFLSIAIPCKLVYSVFMLNLSNGSASCPTGGLLEDFTLPPILMAWPGLIAMLSTAAMDGYAYYLSKSQNFNSEIPFKATVLSCSLTVVCIAIVLVISSAFPPSWKLKIFVPSSTLIISALTIPVTIWYAFPSVAQVQAQLAEAEEEKQLQQELAEEQARQRREDRELERQARLHQQEIVLNELNKQLDQIAAEEKEKRHAKQVQNEKRKTRQAWQSQEEMELGEMSNQLSKGISESAAGEEQTLVEPYDTTEVMPFKGKGKGKGKSSNKRNLKSKGHPKEQFGSETNVQPYETTEVLPFKDEMKEEVRDKSIEDQ